MKTPILTVSEYRKRFAQFVEEIMRLEKKVESLTRSEQEENRLRGLCISENIKLKEKIVALEDILVEKK
jgi:hypothetical protein